MDSVIPNDASNIAGEHQQHPSMNPNSNIPIVDMEFETEDEAYNFYNAYARAIGFSIRKATAHGNPIVYRRYFCSCQGSKPKDKRDPLYKKPRPETRTKCKAHMTVNARITGKFRVTEFVADHNGHEMVDQKQVHMLRSHRTITTLQAEEIEAIDKSGIAPKAGLTLMSEKLGGRDKVGYTLQDLKNHLRSKRTINMHEGDAGGLLHYMRSKQLEDPNFFHAIQVDEEDMITNIFWADGQMIADYAYFGDVVCFDTTYRTNKEDRPFGIFVGVNHHKQSVVLGAAFLYDQTAETFMWLFQTFEEAMGGKKPITIFTDQDATMAKALEEKWPATYHRLCIWHIFQNAATNLISTFSKFPEFKKVLTPAYMVMKMRKNL